VLSAISLLLVIMTLLMRLLLACGGCKCLKRTRFLFQLFHDLFFETMSTPEKF
jgi:hypothetical protein